MDVRHGADAKEPTSPAPVGLQRSRSTSTGLAGLRSLSRRITHKADPSGGNGNVMSFGAILSRTCSSVAYRHGGLPGDEGLPRGLDGDGQGYSSHVLSPAAAMMMRRAFSVRSGSNGYGRIHDTRDEDDEGLQRRAAATVGFEKERKKKKKRDAGRRIVGACKRFLGITSNKL